MKNQLFVLAAISCFSFSARAQSSTAVASGGTQAKVCKTGQGKNDVSCYKTKYAENFKVCKNENGYYICSEVQEYYDSSFLKFMGVSDDPAGLNNNLYTMPSNKKTIDDKTVPQSQSYINTPSGSN